MTTAREIRTTAITFARITVSGRGVGIAAILAE